MNTNVMFSSKSDLWETPQELFDSLDNEFHFTLDACAIPENAKCSNFYTPEQDGLKQEWTGTVWCNPPYGRKIGAWVKKTSEANCKVVMLLPARTDTKWFHDYIYGKAVIRFIKGRLKFGGCKNAAPFPSMIVIFERRSGESVCGGKRMTEQEELALEVLAEQMERARFETFDMGTKEPNNDLSTKD